MKNSFFYQIKTQEAENSSS